MKQRRELSISAYGTLLGLVATIGGFFYIAGQKSSDVETLKIEMKENREAVKRSADELEKTREKLDRFVENWLKAQAQKQP